MEQKKLPEGAEFGLARNSLRQEIERALKSDFYRVYSMYDDCDLVLQKMIANGPSTSLFKAQMKHTANLPFYGYFFKNYWFAWAYFQRVLQECNDQQPSNQDVPQPQA